MARSNRTSPYRQQLRAYVKSWKRDCSEEEWKTDHEELKRRLWAFEDKLALGLSLFQAIETSFWNWRRRVREGEQRFHPEDDVAWRDVWGWWLRPCGRVLAKLTALEAEYGRGQVEGGSQFRRNCESARALLANWPPVVCQKERVAAHTDRSLDPAQVVEELDKVSRSVPEGSVPLKHKADHSQVF